MKKHRQIKKKHHYVWGHHLKQWAEAPDKNEIFHITSKGKIEYKSVKGLAWEPHFYRINPLSKSDFVFLEQLVKFCHPSSHDYNMTLLRGFWQLGQLSHPSRSNLPPDHEFRDIAEAIECNSLENMYTNIEGGVLEPMRHLWRGERNVLNLREHMMPFLRHVAHQVLRTKAAKDKAFSAINDLRPTGNMPDEAADLFQKHWWFIAFILGENMCFSLYATRCDDNHILIKNNSGVPFITSDRPAIYIHQSAFDLQVMQPPLELDLYFPLSPQYAYLINKSRHYDQLSKSIDEKTVRTLNELMAKQADKTIFGNSKEVIQENRKHFNSRE